jgi:signal transduction histidine kinase
LPGTIINLLYLLTDRVKEDEVARNYIGSAEVNCSVSLGSQGGRCDGPRKSVQKAEYGTAGTLFNDVLQLFAGKIRNRQVSVVIEGGENVGFYGTIGQLGQVMANLVSNALQAVLVGGRIWLSSTADGDTMEISIRNDGHGNER